MTPYYVLGLALAGWAVLVALLGIKFERFPGGRGGERVVIAISLLLVIGTLGTVIALSSAEGGAREGGGAASSARG